MKPQEKNLEKRIEETLNSLHAINRATPKPYLLTRINARLDKQVKSVWENMALFISRPLVMVMGLCLLIILNVSVILVNKTKNNTVAERTLSTGTDEEEYAVSFATIDNTENQ